MIVVPVALGRIHRSFLFSIIILFVILFPPAGLVQRRWRQRRSSIRWISLSVHRLNVCTLKILLDVVISIRWRNDTVFSSSVRFSTHARNAIHCARHRLTCIHQFNMFGYRSADPKVRQSSVRFVGKLLNTFLSTYYLLSSILLYVNVIVVHNSPITVIV